MEQDFSYMPPEQSAKMSLRRDCTFIGVMLIVHGILTRYAFQFNLNVLVILGVISQGDLSRSYYGLGIYGYLLLYAITYVLIYLVSSVPLSWMFRRRFPRIQNKAIVGFGDTFFGILTVMGLCGLGNIIQWNCVAWLNGLFGYVPAESVTNMTENSPVGLVWNVVVFALLPALLEELVFRGYILGTLRRYGNTFAVVASSVLFAWIHANPAQIPFALFCGLGLGWLYVKTDNLLLPMAAHMLNNATSSVMSVLSAGMEPRDQVLFNYILVGGYVVVGAISAVILALKKSFMMKIGDSPSVLPFGKRMLLCFTAPTLLAGIVCYLWLMIIRL